MNVQYQGSQNYDKINQKDFFNQVNYGKNNI